ncbi:short-chain dehydrogenase/reductase SDR [Gemmatirosa kalamazoonensis]|uniref:Short-chain dehydrogenase/reductase SDR n=1 Tax=Gemmatirosa kalamazoonensis TaxID=861299 RepID=W0RIJ4_9BACT|nr:SDR family oxidoreductase [Gemmatirosa kalamazoonensis]AHG90242.1 short-chain dehydrogenase/reductase SDR [Gemmatirosa kalamazoonensis]
MSGALAGRSAVVTGASRGIGRAVAQSLAAAGARVALVARSEARLAVLADELARHGEAPLVLPCDVHDAVQVRATAERAAAAFGGVPDVLVNAAGVFALAPIDATDPDDFARAVDANLVGPFRMLHAFVGGMRARGTGHVVTIGSIADHATFPENGAYAASKFGLRGLHEVLRAELRGTGVRATLVSPGPVDTALWDAIDPDARPGFTPRAKMLRAADVADAVLYAVTAPPNVNVDLVRLTPT